MSTLIVKEPFYIGWNTVGECIVEPDYDRFQFFLMGADPMARPIPVGTYPLFQDERNFWHFVVDGFTHDLDWSAMDTIVHLGLGDIKE